MGSLGTENQLEFNVSRHLSLCSPGAELDRGVPRKMFTWEGVPESTTPPKGSPGTRFPLNKVPLGQGSPQTRFPSDKVLHVQS